MRIRDGALLLTLLAAGTVRAQENRALHASAPGAYVEISHSDVLRPDHFTIELWFERGPQIFNDIPDYPLLSKPGLSLQANGHNFPHGLSLSLEGEDGAFLSTQHPIWPDRWYHAAATYDGTVANLYLNGELVDSTAVTWSFPADPGPFSVGKWITHVLYGSLDELRFWNVARPAASIRRAMHVLAPGDRDGLVGYWTFDDAEGSLVTDSSGSDLHGMLIGDARTAPSSAPVSPVLVSQPENVHIAIRDGVTTLSWEPSVSPTLAEYRVYRSDEAAFEPSQATLASVVSRTDTSFVETLDVGEASYYRVAAVDSSGHLSLPSAAAFARMAVQPDEVTVLTPYYLWNDTSGAVWRDGYLREKLNPPQAPSLGEYSVYDSSVVAQHVTWSETYGIDVWLCDWRGPATPGDGALRTVILPQLEGSRVRLGIQYDVALSLEHDDEAIPLSDENLERLEADFRYLSRTYFGEAVYYRRGAMPVVFLKSSHRLTENVAAALDRLRSIAGEEGFAVYLIGDEVQYGRADDGEEPDAARIGAFDAIATYASHDETNHTPVLHNEGTTALGRTYEHYRKLAATSSVDFIPTAIPGFNDRGRRPSTSSGITPRNAHRSLVEPITTLEVQLLTALPFVGDAGLLMMTSFNGYHEDTQVEPLTTSLFTNDDISGAQLFGGFFSYRGRGTELLSALKSVVKPQAPAPPTSLGDVHVAAYYYQWYGLGFDFHWKPAPSYLGQVLDPPYRPLLGEYESDDPDVIRQHIDWSEEYGIDTWVMVYPGFSHLMAPTVEIANQIAGRDVTFSFLHSFGLHADCDLASTLDNAKQQVSLVVDTFFDHPNFWRIDGRPVLVFYLANNYQGDCTTLIYELRAFVREEKGHEMYLFGDVLSEIVDPDRTAPWDGYTAYVAIPTVGYPELGAYYPSVVNSFRSAWDYMDYSWWTFSQDARRRGLDFMPSIGPGYNDRPVRQDKVVTETDGVVLAPQSSPDASLTSTFERAIEIASRHLHRDRPMIVINSFNEWHEGSQIEPAEDSEATNRDTSATGQFYTLGYTYDGYGFDYLNIVNERLGPAAATRVGSRPSVPDRIVLGQNYPNPFNGTTTISFDLPRRMDVSLEIYNLLGRRVTTVLDGTLEAGYHEVDWSAGGAASGVYFYRLEAGDARRIMKLVLLR